MASELSPTVNNNPPMSGKSNAGDGADVSFWLNPTTHRLLVDASVSISGLATAVTDGEAVDAADVGNLAMGTDGSNYQIIKTDSSGELQIDVLSSALPSGAATSAKQDTGNTSLATIAGAVSGVEMQVDVVTSALPTGAATLAEQQTQTASLSVLDDWDNGASDGASVSGDVAHDTADAGEPVKIGMKAVDLGATPTAVTANDRTNWYANRAGIPFVLGGHMNTLNASIQVTDGDGAQTDAAIITVSAGTAIVVTCVEITADKANTVDVSARVGFGTANTPAADAAGLIAFHPGIAAGSGLIKGDGSGIIGIGASNEDLRLTCEDPVTGSVNINVTYHTILIG